jgi:hypothetical protein
LSPALWHYLAEHRWELLSVTLAATAVLATAEWLSVPRSLAEWTDLELMLVQVF